MGAMELCVRSVNLHTLLQDGTEVVEDVRAYNTLYGWVLALNNIFVNNLSLLIHIKL